jgi:hypothetical protein
MTLSHSHLPANIDISANHTRERTERTQQQEKQQHRETLLPPGATMDPAAAAANEAALYDADITITALRQQLSVSEAATLHAQQMAQDRAREAELHLAIIRQLRVEVREAEALRMPPAPRPANARLVLPVLVGSSVYDEVLALRAENRALREQFLRERALGLELKLRFVFLCISRWSFACY